mgnify:CR=1 FL=1
MDGNGRWAEARGLPRAAGHRAGVDALRRVVDACPEFGIEHLTVYSFSTENWARPTAEINALFDLLRLFVNRDLRRLHEAGVRIRILGSRTGLSDDILELIDKSTTLTAQNNRFHLNIAFNYGGRTELVTAFQALARRVEAGELSADEIDETTISQAIWSAGTPDPDLIIRTSGEFRLSNFLLWSSAYSELVFPDAWWPDFDRDHLAAALASYQARTRRFGGLQK